MLTTVSQHSQTQLGYTRQTRTPLDREYTVSTRNITDSVIIGDRETYVKMTFVSYFLQLHSPWTKNTKGLSH